MHTVVSPASAAQGRLLLPGYIPETNQSSPFSGHKDRLLHVKSKEGRAHVHR